jgi:hypothetical protein
MLFSNRQECHAPRVNPLHAEKGLFHTNVAAGGPFGAPFRGLSGSAAGSVGERRRLRLGPGASPESAGDAVGRHRLRLGPGASPESAGDAVGRRRLRLGPGASPESAGPAVFSRQGYG